MIKIKIYVDGACSMNGAEDAVAGWAFAVEENGKIVYTESGCVKNGTNNIGELFAIIQAIQCARKNGFIQFTIVSDSAYCINGVTEWSKNWKKFGWYRNAAKTNELKNKELWMQLDELVEGLNITWEKVKGHTGDPGNELVDKLAKEAARC